MRWVLWLMWAPVDLAIHWNLGLLRLGQELLEWGRLCQENRSRKSE